MNIKAYSAAVVILGFASSVSLAQTAAIDDQQRNVNQQERIEQGLKSGELSTREAGRLEGEQQHIDRLEARDLKDGHISAGEQTRLNKAESNASADIYKQKHDAQTGNPGSASSQRLQTDVQRDANQQQRIQNGLANGSLTNHETSRLEAGQAHTDRKQSLAAANGHVGANEQRNIQRSQNRQSRKIYNRKHNLRNG